MNKAALLKKIRTLAERGVGGEAENAEKLLAHMMEKLQAATPMSFTIQRQGARSKLNSARTALPPKRWKSSIFSTSTKGFGRKKRRHFSPPISKSTAFLQFAPT